MTSIRIFPQLEKLTHDSTHFTWQVLSKFSRHSRFGPYTIQTFYSLLYCKNIPTTEELNKSHLAASDLVGAHSQALVDT